MGVICCGATLLESVGQSFERVCDGDVISKTQESNLVVLMWLLSVRGHVADCDLLEEVSGTFKSVGSRKASRWRSCFWLVAPTTWEGR